MAQGAALSWNKSSAGRLFTTPPLPSFLDYRFQGDGLTVGLWLNNHIGAAAGEVFLNTSSGIAGSPSVALSVVSGGGIALAVADAAGFVASLTTDAACTARLLANPGPHYIAATVDTGAHVLTLAVDGVLCDGDEAATAGWVWVSPDMGALGPSVPRFVLAHDYGGELLGGAWWPRALSTSEAVANYRAGPPPSRL